MEDHDRIGILSHVGNRNLGEEATITAVLENVRARLPSPSFVGFTVRPDDTTDRHGIPAFPLRRGISRKAPPSPYGPAGEGEPSGRDARGAEDSDRPDAGRRPLLASMATRLKSVPGLRPVVRRLRSVLHVANNVVLEVPFLAASFRRVRDLDLLMVVGTQQVRDVPQGPWRYPYTLFKWGVLARLAGVPVVYMGVGAGEVTTRIGRLLLRGALEMAAYRSFRDPGSLRVVRDIGVRADSKVVPDLVLSLPDGSEPGRDENGTVGINVLPYMDPVFWSADDPARHREYVRTVASFTCWLLSNDYAVELFPTHPAVDPEIARRVQEEVRKRAGDEVDPGALARLRYTHVATVPEVRRAISRTDIVVSTRYHGFIFGILGRRPVLGLSYGFKFGQLAERLGISEHVVDLVGMTSADLIDRFRELERDPEKVVRTQTAGLVDARDELARQYDHVLSLRRQSHSLNFAVGTTEG